MVEITMVALIETSNLSYTITIGTLSTKEAKHILSNFGLCPKLVSFFEPFPWEIQIFLSVCLESLWSVSRWCLKRVQGVWKKSGGLKVSHSIFISKYFEMLP